MPNGTKSFEYWIQFDHHSNNGAIFQILLNKILFINQTAFRMN